MNNGHIKQILKDERIHAFLKYNSVRKVFNYFLSQCQKKLKSKRLYSYPIRLTIEPTDICNLKCIHCPTGRGAFGRNKGFMSLDNFKTIIDKTGKYAFLADIYSAGEPFLNKEIFSMIRYAEDSNICTSIHSNFNIRFDMEISQRLVQSGLSYLTLSLDGVDQEIYEMYRRGGRYEKAIENARILIETKRKLKSKKPILTWQFLIFPHNKHQIQDARKIAREMGFDRFKYHKALTPNTAFDYGKEERGEDLPKRKDIIIPNCDWLWQNATFHWDGKIGPCCFQFKEEDDFGALTGQEFKELWNNDQFTYSRSLFGNKRKNIKLREDVICSRCFKVMSGKARN